MTKYIVNANRQEKINRYAKFIIDAKDEKEAEKYVKELLEGTCLAERLRLDNANTERDEGKVSVFAEPIDEFNQDEVKDCEVLEIDEPIQDNVIQK